MKLCNMFIIAYDKQCAKESFATWSWSGVLFKIFGEGVCFYMRFGVHAIRQDLEAGTLQNVNKGTPTYISG